MMTDSPRNGSKPRERAIRIWSLTSWPAVPVGAMVEPAETGMVGSGGSYPDGCSGTAVSGCCRSGRGGPGLTTKATGTGFGLYFSNLRASDLGGRLECDRSYRPGASFVLSLPRPRGN